MATPKPGEIRCPTCHRSTPPATFCTQCGSAIPPDALIRPRGMDRDELQERIRARRSGGDPYRRGASIDEDRGGHQRFEPDAYDASARRTGHADDRRRDYLDEAAAAGAGTAAGAATAASAAGGDITRDRDDWSRPAAAPTPAAAPPPPTYATPPSDVPINDPPEHVDYFEDDAPYDDEQYAYEDGWDEPRERRSGAGALAILGFLALGVLALLGGAVLAGVFGDDPNTGQVDSTPSPSLSIAAVPSATASVAASGAATPAPSGSPAASGDPVVFPDGFTAEAQPCIPGSVSGNGCGSNGASNAGQVEIWVGFTNGAGTDVIGVTVLQPDGSIAGDASIELADINCRNTCNGYTYFPFGGLSPGVYQVEVTRNGEPADSTTFEVT